MRTRYQLESFPHRISSGMYKGRYEIHLIAQTDERSRWYAPADPNAKGFAMENGPARLREGVEYSGSPCWVNGRKWRIVGYYSGSQVMVLIIEPHRKGHRQRRHWQDSKEYDQNFDIRRLKSSGDWDFLNNRPAGVLIEFDESVSNRQADQMLRNLSRAAKEITGREPGIIRL
jgi:hypothetical protein